MIEGEGGGMAIRALTIRSLGHSKESLRSWKERVHTYPSHDAPLAFLTGGRLEVGKGQTGEKKRSMSLPRVYSERRRGILGCFFSFLFLFSSFFPRSERVVVVE